MPSQHKHPPISLRLPEADRAWLLEHAEATEQPVNRVLAEAVAEKRGRTEAGGIVTRFNALHPVGTPVKYWPGVRRGGGRESVTRTPAWLVGGHPCVSVEGYPGGIALTHIEVLEQIEALAEVARTFPATPEEGTDR